MDVDLRFNNTYSRMADISLNKIPAVMSDIEQRQALASPRTDAYVIEIEKVEPVKSLEDWAAFGLSASELEQVRTIHYKNAYNYRYSTSFSELLEDLDPEERKDFLSLASQSVDSGLKGLIEQAGRLNGENRSRFLNAGARMGPGSSTTDLSGAVRGMSGDRLER